MKTKMFYKSSPHGHVGSNTSFHAIEGKGYVTNIDESHLFTEEEAMEDLRLGRVRKSNTQEYFLIASIIDDLSIWKVDHQYIDKHYPEVKDKNDEYLVCYIGKYDGNDLCFVGTKNTTSNYEDALIFNEPDLVQFDQESFKIIPRTTTDDVARRTFEHQRMHGTELSPPLD